jgi:hypothetical protein
MNRKPLKLGFADTFSTAVNFFTKALSERFHIIRDDAHPEYLIYGEGVYGQNHRSFGTEVTKIFYTGENCRPPWGECQFAMTFDHENSIRHYRLPLYVIDMCGAVTEKWTTNYYQLVDLEHDYERDYDERKFCSFVVSNPNQEMRNRAFHFINEYKHVDSGGPHLNNIGHVLPRDKLHYKLDFLNSYRFNICFENGSYPGYVTEKLYNALQVKTMPIYWGSPTVGRDFNSRAFINASDHGDFQKLVNYIQHLDSPAGKQEYLDIIEQPAFKNDIPNCYTSMINLCDWWEQNVMGGK